MQPALELGITAQPTGGSGYQATQIDAPGAEGDGQTPPGSGVDPHQPATHLPRRNQRVGAGLLEHHTIAGFEGLIRAQHQHPLGLQLHQLAHQGATLFAPPAVHQSLMVDALEPAGAQPPGEAQLQLASKC